MECKVNSSIVLLKSLGRSSPPYDNICLRARLDKCFVTLHPNRVTTLEKEKALQESGDNGFDDSFLGALSVMLI